MYFSRLVSACVTIVTMLHVGSAYSVTKGHQILINKGLQSNVWMKYDTPFNLTLFQNAGFTSVLWEGESDMSRLGPAPGAVTWMKRSDSPALMPPQGGEGPYMSKLVAISLGDEQDLNNPTTRAAVAAWFADARTSYPNTLLFTNHYGGQLTNANLAAMITECQPEMLSFDTYPWGPGTTYPWNNGVGASVTSLYGDMQRYRKFALAYGLPYGMYTQTYHAVSEGRRDPSDSELHLNYFAGVALGYTFFTAFRYDQSATSLFEADGITPTALETVTMPDINSKLARLSPVLTRLKSAYTFKTVGVDTRENGIIWYPGQHWDGSTTVTNATPVDYNTYPGDYFNFYQDTHDNWLRGMTVTNIGTKNLGSNNFPARGDVAISWFRILDESYDGPSHTGQVYYMLYNGLSDPTGTSVQCRQRIRLNFLSSAPATIERFNQQTGVVETLSVPVDGATGRRLPTFDIDGGGVELFKFGTGAPFAGFYQATVDDWGLYD